MSHRYFSLVSISVLLSWIGLGFLTCGNKPKEEKEQAQLPVRSSLLYEVSGNGLTKPSYVFGTIHIISSEDFFFPRTFEKAFKKADKLVMEIDLKDIMGQMNLLTIAKMPEGRTLKEFYSDDEWKEIRQIATDSLGVDLELFKAMKPIFIQQNLLVSNIFGPDVKSYELHFLELANKRGLPMGGLESAGEQMKILDSISLEDQAAMLKESILNFRKEKNELNRMIGFYKSQEVDSLYAITVSEDGLEGAEDALLTNRNVKWIPLVEEEMKKQPTFFAVGAAHLGGPNGLLQLLRNKGYSVTPL